MADLIIRTTGEVLLDDMEVARISFTKPYCEAELAGEYVPESYASGSENQSDYDELEDQYDDVEAALKIARKALFLAQRLVLGVLPKFNWGAAALTADEIALLNEAPIQIEHALIKASEVL